MRSHVPRGHLGSMLPRLPGCHGRKQNGFQTPLAHRLPAYERVCSCPGVRLPPSCRAVESFRLHGAQTEAEEKLHRLATWARPPSYTSRSGGSSLLAILVLSSKRMPHDVSAAFSTYFFASVRCLWVALLLALCSLRLVDFPIPSLYAAFCKRLLVSPRS